MTDQAKLLGAVSLLAIAIVGTGVHCSEDDDEARARAIKAADSWLRYADNVRAVACKQEEDEGTTCLVVGSSGLAVTIRCDRGAVWECSPVEIRP